MDRPLINRVANSPLQTINLEHFWPKQEMVDFDLKDYLFMELILKEKDFRTALKELDWEDYRDKIICVHCSSDAIIPLWAYMLVAQHASGVASDIYHGSKEEYLSYYYKTTLSAMSWEEYEDKPVVIKGCSNQPVPPAAYLTLTQLLRPIAKSILFGEPCSTVPIFKKPRKVARP